MTRISEAAAAQFLNYPKNLKDVVLVHIADDWLLMTYAEYEQFLRTDDNHEH